MTVRVWVFEPHISTPAVDGLFWLILSLFPAVHPLVAVGPRELVVQVKVVAAGTASFEVKILVVRRRRKNKRNKIRNKTKTKNQNNQPLRRHDDEREDGSA